MLPQGGRKYEERTFKVKPRWHGDESKWQHLGHWRLRKWENRRDNIWWKRNLPELKEEERSRI